MPGAGGGVDAQLFSHLSSSPCRRGARPPGKAAGRAAGWCRCTPALFVQPGLSGEHPQGAADESHAAVRVVAGATSLGQPGPAVQIGPRPGVRPGPGQVAEGRRDPRQAVEAGTALARRLQSQVTGYPRGLSETAPAGGERGHHAGPDGRPEWAQRTIGQGQPGRLGRGKPGAVVAPDQHSLHWAAEVDQAVQGDAERHFGHAYLAVRKVQRGQHAPRLFGEVPHAVRRPPGFPYRMISARWASVSTFCTRTGWPVAIRGSPRTESCASAGRAVRRGGWPAPTPHQPGSGPAPPAVRCGGGVHSRGGPFGDRQGQLLVQPPVAPHVKHGGPGACRRRGDLQPVEDQVRGGREQREVLAAGGLAFGAVAGHDRGRLAGRCRGELAVGGERGPATAGQAGGLHLGDDPPHGACLRRSAPYRRAT